MGRVGPLPPTVRRGDDPRTPSCGSSSSAWSCSRSASARRSRRRARLGVLLPVVRHPAHDGAYQHWSQHGHAPPDDIASSYYPARGLYSSSDRLVVGAQMGEIRDAGIDEIVVSWWGRGSAEDSRCRR